MQPDPKKLLSPDACAQCGSLYTVPKHDMRFCKDCKALSLNGEVVEAGDLDLHYSLDVLDAEDRTLWVDSVYVLFQAQCHVAHGLKISPGSSFTNWLKSKEAPEGYINDPITIQTLHKIAGKILKHRQFIEDPYITDSVENLHKVLLKSRKMVLTFKKR